MATFNSNKNMQPTALLEPDVVATVIEKPVMEQSLAALLSQQMQTDRESVIVPTVTKDPTARWTAEGAEITTDDMEMKPLVIRPAKVAGLTVVTRELADDSSADAANLVGSGLTRDIVRQIDAAYFGALEAPAPSGLAALEGTTEIKAGTAFSSLDPFIDAMQAAQSQGHPLTAYAANPADVAALAKIKKATGSAERLLTTERDATGQLVRHIDGVPLMATPHVEKGTIWGIPSTTSIFVRRTDTRVEVSDQVYFSSDRIAIRAIMRVGWGVINPAAIIKLTAAE
ncbi:phage major capsid protein [Corynebacterium jeikeium]|nr:phage major capsid protein [Corynebacterium jeikeium]